MGLTAPSICNAFGDPQAVSLVSQALKRDKRHLSTLVQTADENLQILETPALPRFDVDAIARFRAGIGSVIVCSSIYIAVYKLDHIPTRNVAWRFIFSQGSRVISSVSGRAISSR
jgi:hypothetical protein